jgi:hypothetical protein
MRVSGMLSLKSARLTPTAVASTLVPSRLLKNAQISASDHLST